MTCLAVYCVDFNLITLMIEIYDEKTCLYSGSKIPTKKNRILLMQSLDKYLLIK